MTPATTVAGIRAISNEKLHKEAPLCPPGMQRPAIMHRKSPLVQGAQNDQCKSTPSSTIPNAPSTTEEKSPHVEAKKVRKSKEPRKRRPRLPPSALGNGHATPSLPPGSDVIVDRAACVAYPGSPYVAASSVCVGTKRQRPRDLPDISSAVQPAVKKPKSDAPPAALARAHPAAPGTGNSTAGLALESATFMPASAVAPNKMTKEPSAAAVAVHKNLPANLPAALAVPEATVTRQASQSCAATAEMPRPNHGVNTQAPAPGKTPAPGKAPAPGKTPAPGHTPSAVQTPSPMLLQTPQDALPIPSTAAHRPGGIAAHSADSLPVPPVSASAIPKVCAHSLVQQSAPQHVVSNSGTDASTNPPAVQIPTPVPFQAPQELLSTPGAATQHPFGIGTPFADSRPAPVLASAVPNVVPHPPERPSLPSTPEHPSGVSGAGGSVTTSGMAPHSLGGSSALGQRVVPAVPAGDLRLHASVVPTVVAPSTGALANPAATPACVSQSGVGQGVAPLQERLASGSIAQVSPAALPIGHSALNQVTQLPAVPSASRKVALTSCKYAMNGAALQGAPGADVLSIASKAVPSAAVNPGNSDAAMVALMSGQEKRQKLVGRSVEANRFLFHSIVELIAVHSQLPDQSRVHGEISAYSSQGDPLLSVVLKRLKAVSICPLLLRNCQDWGAFFQEFVAPGTKWSRCQEMCRDMFDYCQKATACAEKQIIGSVDVEPFLRAVAKPAVLHGFLEFVWDYLQDVTRPKNLEGGRKILSVLGVVTKLHDHSSFDNEKSFVETHADEAVLVQSIRLVRKFMFKKAFPLAKDAERVTSICKAMVRLGSNAKPGVTVARKPPSPGLTGKLKQDVCSEAQVGEVQCLGGTSKTSSLGIDPARVSRNKPTSPKNQTQAQGQGSPFSLATLASRTEKKWAKRDVDGKVLSASKNRTRKPASTSEEFNQIKKVYNPRAKVPRSILRVSRSDAEQSASPSKSDGRREPDAQGFQDDGGGEAKSKSLAGSNGVDVIDLVKPGETSRRVSIATERDRLVWIEHRNDVADVNEFFDFGDPLQNNSTSAAFQAAVKERVEKCTWRQFILNLTKCKAAIVPKLGAPADAGVDDWR